MSLVMERSIRTRGVTVQRFLEMIDIDAVPEYLRRERDYKWPDGVCRDTVWLTQEDEYFSYVFGGPRVVPPPRDIAAPRMVPPPPHVGAPQNVAAPGPVPFVPLQVPCAVPGSPTPEVAAPRPDPAPRPEPAAHELQPQPAPRPDRAPRPDPAPGPLRSVNEDEHSVFYRLRLAENGDLKEYVSEPVGQIWRAISVRNELIASGADADGPDGAATSTRAESHGLSADSGADASTSGAPGSGDAPQDAPAPVPVLVDGDPEPLRVTGPGEIVRKVGKLFSKKRFLEVYGDFEESHRGHKIRIASGEGFEICDMERCGGKRDMVSPT